MLFHFRKINILRFLVENEDMRPDLVSHSGRQRSDGDKRTYGRTKNEGGFQFGYVAVSTASKTMRDRFSVCENPNFDATFEV